MANLMQRLAPLAQQFLEKISPRVELVAGDGDVQTVLLWQAVSLVDRAPGKIKHVSRMKHRLENGFTNLILAEVGRAEPRQSLALLPRTVEPPVLRTLKLAHEHLNIIPVRSKALSARWRQVDISTNH